MSTGLYSRCRCQKHATMWPDVQNQTFWYNLVVTWLKRRYDYRKTQTCDTMFPTPPYTFVFNMPLYFHRSTLFYFGFLPSAVHAAVLQFGTHSKSLSVSHTSPSLLPDWFSHCPGPLPATTATQLSPVSFMVGMHTGLLWLRIELWESFAGSGESTTATLWTVDLEKNLNYMGMWHTCAWRVWGCCSWEWLTASMERDSGSDCIGKASRLRFTQSNQLPPVHANV